MNKQSEIVNILKDLISIPSVTANKAGRKKSVKYVERFFDSSNFKIFKIRKNGFDTLIIANTKADEYKVLLLGHLDVVPGPASVFKPKIVGDRMYGRGASDMKGPVAVMLALMKDLNVNYPLALVLTTDEETGGNYGARIAAEKLRAETVLVPDGGSSLLKISNATRGIAQFKIAAQTVGGSSTDGVNAIDAVLAFYDDLKKRLEKLKKKKDFITLNLGKIQGGDAVNQAAQNAEMFLDLRFTKQSAKPAIESLIRKLKKRYKLQIEEIGSSSPLFTPPSNKYLQSYKSTVEQILKQRAEFYRQNGTHDGRYFRNKTTAIIATRPLSAGMHSDQEWVSIPALLDLYRIYKSFLEKIK